MLKLFLSYRRSDTAGRYLAHMLFRELRTRYGDTSVFLDVDSRSPGLSFPSKVKAALDACDAVLVVIGPEWLAHLKARLGDRRDWVRYEVAESLKRQGLPVVPVCHGSTAVPDADELPADLQDLSWRDGVSLDPFQDFDAHLGRLLGDLERVVKDQRSSEAASSQMNPPARVPSPPATSAPTDSALEQAIAGAGNRPKALNASLPPEPTKTASDPTRHRATARTMRALGFDSNEVIDYLTSIGAEATMAQEVVASIFRA